MSDFQGKRVLRLTEDGSATTVLEVPSQPAGLGWLPDGSLLVVSMHDRRILRLVDGVVSVYADLSAFFPGWANDMCVTPSGNAYVGNFGFDFRDRGATTSRTCLVMVTADGVASIAADDLAFPNACVLSGDQRELIVNETLAGRHTAFTIALDGSLSGRRVWAQLGTPPADPDHARDDLVYGPDGGCLDTYGKLWVADAWGHRVLRIEEGGRILFETSLPGGLNAYACCLGGPNATTLMVAAAPGLGSPRQPGVAESVLFLLDVSEELRTSGT